MRPETFQRAETLASQNGIAHAPTRHSFASWCVDLLKPVCLVLIAMGSGAPLAGQEFPFPRLNDVMHGRAKLADWQLVSPLKDVPPAALRDLQAQTGVPVLQVVSGLARYRPELNPDLVQFAVARCVDAEDAIELARKIRQRHRDPFERVIRRRQWVLELSRGKPETVARARVEFQLSATERRHHVQFWLYPAEARDLRQLVTLFGQLKGISDQADDPADSPRVAEWPAIQANPSVIALRTFGMGTTHTTYEPPRGAALEEQAGRFHLTWPVELRLPMELQAQITCRSFAAVPARSGDEGLIGATANWPTESRDFFSFVKSRIPPVPQGSEASILLSDLTAIQRLFPHSPGEKATSRRRPLVEVMASRDANAWERSDLLITLCRHRGFAARQVYGWRRDGSRHVWVEVLLKSLGGWVQVDPSWALYCDDSYLPLFHSDDGSVELAYSPATVTLDGE